MFNNLAIAFVIGALLALFCDSLLSQAVLVALSLLVVLCFLAGWRRLQVVGCFALGFTWAVIYSQYVLSQWLPAEQEGQSILVTGYIEDFPRATDDGWQLDFHAEEFKGKLRLTTRDLQDENFPDFSCRYRLRVKLKQPRGLLNFNQYDYQAWLLQAGYRATGYIQAVETCEAFQADIFLRLREAVDQAIKNAKLSDYAGSTLSALLIGNYADIDSMQWRVLRDSGTIHLLSVSGLHIVLVVVLFHFLFKRLVCLMVFPLRYWPADLWASVFALAFAVFYALMTGFSVATQRSLIMVTVAVLQRIVYGKFQLKFIFLMSLVLVVIANPLSMLSVCFWFTFVATAVLLLASHTVSPLRSSWLHRYVAEPFRLHLIMFVVMLPVLLYVYGKVSLLSLPMNIIAVPWVSFVSLPCGFAALALMPVSAAFSNKLLQLSAWSLDVYWTAMQWVVESFSEWQWQLGGVSLTVLLLLMACVGSLCFFSFQLHWRIFCLLLCVPLLFSSSIDLPEKTVEVQVLDVGQGLAVVVRTATHFMVFDAGDKHSERFDAGRDIVATALRNMRARRINMLVISHAHSDHAGGRLGLLDEIAALQKWSGSSEQLGNDEGYLPCSGGMHWRWDGVDFRVLYPINKNENIANDENNNSCVIQIDAGGKRLLLTGDIEKQAEQQLLNANMDLQANVLVSPHHGSKTSSSSSFLSAVNAETVIVSSGYKNRFHHPAKIVQERYQNFGMAMLNTAEVGAVKIRLTDMGIDIEKTLCAQRFFWREARYNAHCSP